MPSLLLWLVLTAFLLAGAIGWTWSATRWPVACAAAVVAMACFSAHVFALIYQAGASAEVVRLFIPVKDAMAGLLALVLVWRALGRGGPRPRWLLSCLVLGGLVGLLGISLAVDRGSASQDLFISIRNAAVPVEAAFTGLLLTTSERARAVRWAVLIVAVAAAAALVEYVFPVSLVRDVVGVGHYWEDVKQQSYHLSPQGTDLPGNFFTSSGARRLSGPFGDPLSAGYMTGIAVVAAVVADRQRWTVPVVGLLGLALVLTFTRGGWIIAAGGLLPYLVIAGRRRGRRGLVVLALAAFGASTALLGVPTFRDYITGVVQGRDDSTRGHVKALLRLDDRDYSPLGDGWGAAGGAVGRGTENVFATVGLQVGVVGLLLYLATLIVLTHRAARQWAEPGLLLPFLGLIGAVVVTMVVSEQLLTFNAGWGVIFLTAASPGRRPGSDLDATGPRPLAAGRRD